MGFAWGCLRYRRFSLRRMKRKGPGAGAFLRLALSWRADGLAFDGSRFAIFSSPILPEIVTFS